MDKNIRICLTFFLTHILEIDSNYGIYTYKEPLILLTHILEIDSNTIYSL